MRRAPLAICRGFLGAAMALSLASCASAGRFPLREPFTRDTDLVSTRVPCRNARDDEDPSHLACMPREYVSPLVWDGADNMVFRPLSEALAVEASSEAQNVNSLDEVPDSAWFQNRIGVRPFGIDELVRGACTEAQLLEPGTAAPGSYLIDKGKPNGASPGFRVRVPDGSKYMFKSDAPVPERPSAASVIGAAVYHAVGFNTSCEQIVYIDPRVLELKPGLRFTTNFKEEQPFDRAALDAMLAGVTRRGDHYRFQASAWLPGVALGPFRYQGTRADDPNDVIPHEHRRELRGGRLLAAWLHHFDAREQNSMDVWMADNPAVPDSSPGRVVHYYLDTSDSFGSEWEWDALSRRLGHSYVLDWGDLVFDFVTLGLVVRPWERVKRTRGQEIFGYFDVENFDPEAWKMEYPNAAFSRMTERDGAWMARILARFTAPMIDELAALGDFENPAHEAYLARVLRGRLARILRRYLTRLSPLADVRIVRGNELCVVDLARLAAVRPAAQFRYRARTERLGPLPLVPSEHGRVCVTLSHIANEGGAADDAPERYVTIRLENGVARGPLVTHLYDLGPRRGFRLVGLERPED